MFLILILIMIYWGMMIDYERERERDGGIVCFVCCKSRGRGEKSLGSRDCFRSLKVISELFEVI